MPMRMQNSLFEVLGSEQIEVERTKDLYRGENLSEEIKEFIE